MTDDNNSVYIETNADLKQHCQAFADCEYLAIDTEFLRERTFYPKLCLIQIASHETTVCIDVLAITNLQPLIDLLADKKILKVFHAAQQDLEVIYHEFKISPQPLFDTQVAASLLGWGDGIGYASFVNKAMGVSLAKGLARTDWCRRPLSPAQLQYAADDVFYLVQAYAIQRKALLDKDRLHWLDSEFERMSGVDYFTQDPDTVWKKVKGHQKLRGQALAVLKSLASWREQQAKTEDRPRRRVLADDVLVDLSQQQPDSIEELHRSRFLHKRNVDEYGKALLANIVEAKKIPKEQWPQLVQKSGLSKKEEALIDAVSALLKTRALDQSLSPQSLATRSQLEAIVRGQSDIPLLQGWRYEYAGKDILAFLEGNGVLAVADNSLLFKEG